MELHNLTPHPVTLGGVTYPSEGVARVSEQVQAVGDLDGLPVLAVAYGEPVGLPPEKPGTIYIVSGLVLDALRGRRNDLVAPYTGGGEFAPERDAQGRIVSCKAVRR